MNKLFIFGVFVVSFIPSTKARESVVFKNIEQDYKLAISQFHDKSQQCENGHPGLQTLDLGNVNLKDKKTLMTMVNYYYFHTLYTCLIPELNSYSKAATKLWAQDQSNKEALYKMNYLMMNIPTSLEQAKIDYLEVPAHIRNSYDKISKLQTSFDMLETINNLDL